MSNEPAFPAPDKTEYEFGANQRGRVYNGMTLRDYFAAKAMQGLLAADTDWSMAPETIAKLSVEQADAMMKAREA